MQDMISVLLVDDEPALLEVTCIFLEKNAEMKVKTALSGNEALDLLKSDGYDAVISDYEMPEMDGIQFLKEIRKIWPNLPFIIFTGRGREEVAIEALNEGADFYLQKGGHPRSQFAELENMVKRAVFGKRALEELRLSEERYRAVVETQHEFISRFRPDGTHIFANRSFCQYYGRPCSEIIGHRFIPSMPAEERERVRQHLASLTPKQPTATIENRVTLPDGTVRWQQWSDTAIFENDGTIREYQSVGRDITRLKMGEEALRESERRLVDIINHLPDATLAIDRKGVVIAWNHAIEEMTGVPAADILGRGDHAYSVPFYGVRRPILIDLIFASPEEIRKYYTGIWQDGTTLTAETALPRPKGEQRTLWGKASPLYDDKGELVGAIESIRDITEQKKTERELARNREQLSSFMQNLHVGLYRNTPGPTGRILMANPKIAQMFGYDSLEEFMQLPVSALYADPEERQVTSDRLITEKSLNGYEVGFRKKNGDTFIGRISATAIRDDTGTILYFDGVVEDITPLKEAEIRLKENEERYRLFLQNANDAVYVHETTPEGPGRFIEVNDRACQMLGYSRQELLGMDVGQIDVPEQHEKIPAIMKELFATGRSVFETEHLAKDGRRIPVEVSTSLFPIRGRSTILSFARDITERKRITAALQNASGKISLVSEITHHDIVNQLTVLQEYLDLARAKSSHPEMNDFIDKLEHIADTIGQQIRFTRDYYDVGENAPIWQPLGGALSRAAAMLPPGDISVEMTDPEKVEVKADPLLERALYNLIDNSLRHGMHVSAIRCRYREEPGGLVIVLEDNGTGVPAGIKAKIFDRGFGKNTGYGLFLVHEILAITGMSIAETGNAGEGARFEIRVPKGYYRYGHRNPL